jgi:DNA-binding transcriptional regulator YbjK
MRIENLKASVLNVSEYRAALAALKAGQPTKAELAAIVEELTGIKAASSATVRDLYRNLERHGANERRHEARAKISRRIMPL